MRLLQQVRQLRDQRGNWDWACAGEPGSPEPSRLWQFQLHSFGLAPPLARLGKFALLEELATNWVTAHPVPSRAARNAAWDSYCISNRLENWAYAEAVTGKAFPAAVRASCRQQAAFLASHLEFDIRGNHLVRNAAALLVAGMWLRAPEAERWRARAIATLDRCFRTQVLADGGHYERSPMYHLLVMEDAAQSIEMLRRAHAAPGVADRLAGTLSRMRHFAAALREGDGEIALLNDSCRGVAPHPAELLARLERLLGGLAGQAEPQLFPESGFAILRSIPWKAIVDGGPLGPDEQPAHAHCDLGSVLASYGTEQILADTGVFEYQAGERRRYCRSTAAHNTLQIGNDEQGDCWGEFRLGRRARPISLSTPGPGACRLEYAWPGVPVRHRRQVALGADGLAIGDEVDGRGVHDLTLRWHLAPGLAPIAPGDWQHWATASGLRLKFSAEPGWEWAAEPTPFYPEFGTECQRLSLVGRRRAALPASSQVRFSIKVDS